MSEIIVTSVTEEIFFRLLLLTAHCDAWQVNIQKAGAILAFHSFALFSIADCKFAVRKQPKKTIVIFELFAKSIDFK